MAKLFIKIPEETSKIMFRSFLFVTSVFLFLVWQNIITTSKASLLIGVCCLFLWRIPLVGTLISILVLVWGSNNVNSPDSGYAIGGIILGSIGLIAAIINGAIGAKIGWKAAEEEKTNEKITKAIEWVIVSPQTWITIKGFNYFQFIIDTIKEAGLWVDDEKIQEKRMKEITDMIAEAVRTTILNHLNSDDLLEFYQRHQDHWLTLEEKEQFYKEKIPDFNHVIEQALIEYSKEFIANAKKLNPPERRTIMALPEIPQDPRGQELSQMLLQETGITELDREDSQELIKRLTTGVFDWMLALNILARQPSAKRDSFFDNVFAEGVFDGMKATGWFMLNLSEAEQKNAFEDTFDLFEMMFYFLMGKEPPE